MGEHIEKSEAFSALILLTAPDKIGISKALFETLSPFAVSIVDIDQIIISSRLILTVQILLNPAHQEAIEKDLEILAEQHSVDIASVFSDTNPPRAVKDQVVLTITTDKLLPRYLEAVTSIIASLGGNIEKFNRVSVQPLSISISISNISHQEILQALEGLEAGVQAMISLD